MKEIPDFYAVLDCLVIVPPKREQARNEKKGEWNLRCNVRATRGGSLGRNETHVVRFHGEVRDLVHSWHLKRFDRLLLHATPRASAGVMPSGKSFRYQWFEVYEVELLRKATGEEKTVEDVMPELV